MFSFVIKRRSQYLGVCRVQWLLGGEEGIEKKCQRKGLWPNLRYYLCLTGLRKPQGASFGIQEVPPKIRTAKFRLQFGCFTASVDFLGS
jgi:hypothetical protein